MLGYQGGRSHGTGAEPGTGAVDRSVGLSPAVVGLVQPGLHRGEPAFKAYHSVTWPQRTAVATVYLGLIAALVYAMHAAYVTPPS